MRILEGIRVLEVGQYIAGPYCSMLLADQGAEVIKIERPGVGDPRRSYDPLVRRNDVELSGGFLSYNRNKKSVTINLRHPEGQEIFRRLGDVSDLIVENLRPGAMDRLGLGYDVLSDRNPRLIYCAISGFGRLENYRGPFADRPAFDAAIQAMGGLMSLVGEADGPPLITMTGLADIYTSVWAALGISTALFARERTGRGTFIDQAMYDSIVSLIERAIMVHAFTGEVPTRGTDRFAPVGAFRAKDGFVAAIIPTDEMWERLCSAIERPDLLERPELATVLERSAHFTDIVRPEVEGWTSQRTRREIVERLVERGLPAGEVQTVDEVYHCPHVAARRMLLEFDGDGTGSIRLPRTPLLFSAFDEPSAKPPPTLGEHNEEILAGLLGEDGDALRAWHEAGVI